MLATASLPRQLRLLGVAPCALPPGEIAVDLFAGAGGWSLGFARASGAPPAVAVNHDPHAIQLHEANHPEARHFCERVQELDPLRATQGQPVGWLHMSPDCTHFSRAKGGKPRDQNIRGLAWAGVAWAAKVRPRILSLENVPEFTGWGPLLDDGRPDPTRAGETFRGFVTELQALGYAVEWRTLVAADYGAPTIRRRLFLLARCDGQPIRWPAPTHGPKGAEPYRTAADCIDWSLPCPSIFERKRPLAPATCRRIAAGIVRYVLQGRPFIVQTAHGDFADRAGVRAAPLDAPLGTVTGSNDRALVAPVMIRNGHGEVQCSGIDQPVRTVLAQGTHHACVAAFLAKHNGKTVGQPAGVPLHTATGTDTKAVVAAHLTVFREGDRARGLDQPLPTVTSGAGAARPAGAAHAMGLAAAHLVAMNSEDGHASRTASIEQPLGTVIASAARHALCAAFLVQYYSTRGQHSDPAAPLPAVVARARHGLVTVDIDGETYALADIGMRMLQPRELARAQGFPDDYTITGTKAQQIARIGNSVCPGVAAALVRANLEAA